VLAGPAAYGTVLVTIGLLVRRELLRALRFSSPHPSEPRWWHALTVVLIVASVAIIVLRLLTLR
jgi:hypothetical protein